MQFVQWSRSVGALVLSSSLLVSTASAYAPLKRVKSQLTKARTLGTRVHEQMKAGKGMLTRRLQTLTKEDWRTLKAKVEAMAKRSGKDFKMTLEEFESRVVAGARELERRGKVPASLSLLALAAGTTILGNLLMGGTVQGLESHALNMHLTAKGMGADLAKNFDWTPQQVIDLFSNKTFVDVELSPLNQPGAMHKFVHSVHEFAKLNDVDAIQADFQRLAGDIYQVLGNVFSHAPPGGSQGSGINIDTHKLAENLYQSAVTATHPLVSQINATDNSRPGQLGAEFAVDNILAGQSPTFGVNNVTGVNGWFHDTMLVSALSKSLSEKNYPHLTEVLKVIQATHMPKEQAVGLLESILNGQRLDPANAWPILKVSGQ